MNEEMLNEFNKKTEAEDVKELISFLEAYYIIKKGMEVYYPLKLIVDKPKARMTSLDTMFYTIITLVSLLCKKYSDSTSINPFNHAIGIKLKINKRVLYITVLEDSNDTKVTFSFLGTSRKYELIGNMPFKEVFKIMN